MNRVVARRMREQEALLERARAYVSALSRELNVACAVVYGSVARGDFNAWSDVDVLIVSDDLVRKTPDRLFQLSLDGHPRIQAVGFTRVEFTAALHNKNPLVLEASRRGVPLVGTLDASGDDGNHARRAPRTGIFRGRGSTTAAEIGEASPGAYVGPSLEQ